MDFDISGFIFAALVAFPLAIWKLIDIGIWLCSHVSVAWQ